jgi:hypothetical protein
LEDSFGVGDGGADNRESGIGRPLLALLPATLLLRSMHTLPAGRVL